MEGQRRALELTYGSNYDLDILKNVKKNYVRAIHDKAAERSWQNR